MESTDKGTGVLSIEGEVTVLGLAGGRVVLQPGQGTDVPPGGRTAGAGDLGRGAAPGCDRPHDDLSRLPPRPRDAPGLRRGSSWRSA